MSVKFLDAFKFPITSAPTPIPDPELYEEKILPDGRKVWISAPLPDKLVIVIPISKWVYAKHIAPTLSVSAFMEMFVEHVTNPPSMTEVLGPSKYAFNTGQWQTTILVFGKRDARVHVSRASEKNLGTVVRLDLNPRKLGVSGCKQLQKFLCAMFDKAEFLKSARVRRLDIAVDVVGLPVADIVVTHKDQVKRTMYIGGDGQLETVYLHKKPSKTKLPKDPDGPEKPKLPNRPAGDVLVRIYDREKYAQTLSKPAAFGGAPVTRVELTRSRWKDFRLEKLAGMADPLVKLRVGYVGSQIGQSSMNKWATYLAASRTLPHSAIVNMLALSADEADALEKALAVPNPDLVGSGENWLRWAEGLATTGLANLL